MEAITVAASFSSRALKRSRPVDLLVFRVDSCLMTGSFDFFELKSSVNLVWWARGRGRSGIFLFNCVRQSYSDSEKVVEKRCYRFDIFVLNTIGYNGTRGRMMAYYAMLFRLEFSKDQRGFYCSL